MKLPPIALPSILQRTRVCSAQKEVVVPSDAGAQHGGTSHLDLISFFLREPQSQTAKLLEMNLRYIKEVEGRRQLGLNPERLLKHRRSFRFEQAGDYLRLLKEDRRSRIIAAYHFGDYVYGMNYLACFEPSSRHRVVLSQSRDEPVQRDNMRNCFGAKGAGEDAQLLVSETNSSQISALLRQHNCTLTFFCDLPSGFGKRVEVNFLGRLAKFPRGLATLALVNKVPILPVINYRDGAINNIYAFPQIEPVREKGESLTQAATGITQCLVDYFSQHFLRTPQQWRYMHLLPQFFIGDDSGRPDRSHVDK